MPGGQRGGSSPSDALDTDANPSCLTEEKDRLSQRAPRRGGATRTAPRDHARSGTPDGEGVIPVLARTVRQVEAAAQRGKVRPSQRTAYQVVALLVREERARVKADTTISESERTAMLTRLEGIATILAKTAARDTSLLELLTDGAVVSSAAIDLKNDLLRAAGREPEPEPTPVVSPTCLLYTSPSPRDRTRSRMPSSA